ncbi:hypothetical protein CP973_37950 [Streptomyces albofaciens JCM 4342]|uniref:hypothetical protein n=1 Tax=Streptomyces albofaciens TaxID=66866 RepID=UPI00123A551F|nr:hypothetical protein [Streptomyces albofaciens]KAA6214819.1 hypothetical protein CP973_37950 [Streptomyces albofaciens JCM 4342]
MSSPAHPPLPPDHLAHLARRAGLPLPSGRLAGVAATVHAIDTVLGALRGVPLGETPPAPSFTAVPGVTPSRRTS